jgi:hypothetical protein
MVTPRLTPRWVTGIPAASGPASVAQGEDLLSPATEHEGVPTLQSNDCLVATGKVGEQRVDLALVRGVAGRLADVNDLRVGIHEPHDRLVHQSVAHDDVSVAEDPRRTHRQEIRLSRPGAY